MMAPSARNAISDLKPLQGFPIKREPAGIVIRKPSLYTGIPYRLTNTTPVFAASIFMGNDIVLIKASGSGIIKTKYISEKRIALVNRFPKIKSEPPIPRKKSEPPDIEKI